MNQLLERLRQMFEDEEARYVYADSTVNAFIAGQIRALREDRKLNQDDLATLIGTKQSGISRLEKADYSSWKIETLRKIARAFGVRLKVSFEEFGSLPPEIGDFTKARLAPRKFEDDPVFCGTVEDNAIQPSVDQLVARTVPLGYSSVMKLVPKKQSMFVSGMTQNQIRPEFLRNENNRTNSAQRLPAGSIATLRQVS